MGKIISGIIIGGLIGALSTSILLHSGKINQNNELSKVKQLLQVDGNSDIKELTIAVEKLKQKLETFEKESKLLREERNKLEQQLKARDDYIAEMTNKFIVEGLKGEFAKKTDERKTAGTPQTQKSAEDIIKELENAVEKKDWLKAADLILELIKMGPTYYQKALEFAAKLKEARIKKSDKEIATLSEEERKKFVQEALKEQLQFAHKLFGYMSEEEFLKFTDWVLTTNADIDIENPLFNIMAASTSMDLSLQEKLYSFVKNKLANVENTGENIKRYGNHMAMYSDTNQLLQDVANINNALQVRLASAYALGKKYALGFPSHPASADKQIPDKEKVKEQFQNSISNLPDKEILQKYFEMGTTAKFPFHSESDEQK